MNLKKIVSVILVLSFFATPVVAKDPINLEGAGYPNISAILGQSGDTLVKVNNDGELEVAAQFSGTVQGTSLLTDDNGDTAEIDSNRNLQVILRSNQGDTIGTDKNALHTYSQYPQRSLFDEGTGDTLRITPQGEAKVDASVTINSTSLTDDEGDTQEYRLSPSNGYKNISLAPGSSQTVTFSSTAYRVSINATGATEYRYELNSNSSDTNSMPLFKGQYVEKSNGSYNKITFFNLYTNSNNANITVEPEF